MASSRVPGVAWVAIARCLEREDVLQWLVAALEARDRELFRLLRYESAVSVGNVDVVYAAAASGSFFALAALLRGPSDCLSDETKVIRFVSSARQRLFPAQVIYGALTRIQDPAKLLKTVQWLHPRTQYDAARAVEAAARRRQLAVAQWIADAADRQSVEVVVRVDKTVQVLHWLEREPIRNGSGVLVRSWLASQVHGCAPVRAIVRYDDAPLPLYPAMDWAAERGDVAFLQALQDDKRVAWPCSTRAMDAAAAHGDLDVVQWLQLNRSEGCSWAAMDGAASDGHLGMVKWLYYMRQERGSASAFLDAAANGHLEILQWQSTRFPNFQLSTTALERVASRGHLRVLQWVHETKQTVRATPGIMESAINGGHLDIVQWLVSKNQPHYQRRLMRPHLLGQAASAPGRMPMLQWLWGEFQVVSTAWLSVAAENNCMAIVEWLLESEDMLRPEERSLRPETLHLLAERGHWAMLEWLLTHQTHLCLACAFLPNQAVLRKRSSKLQVDAGHGHDLSWLARYVRLVLRFAPTLCPQETSRLLAQWAAHQALDDILIRVWGQHPGVASDKAMIDTVIACMATHAASELVGVIVSERPEWITRNVVQWAATYVHVPLLDTLFMKTDPNKRFVLLRTTALTAVRHGHVVVVAWVRKNEHNIPGGTRDLWRGVSLVAARHDQVSAIAYLCDEGLVCEPKEVIRGIAVKHRSIGIVQWLTTATSFTSRVVPINPV